MSSQRSALASFMQITQAPEKVAVKFLKNAGWNVQNAVNVFFAGGGSGSGGAGASGGGGASKSAEANINKVFDEYRRADDPKDTITVAGTMAYLQALGLDLEEPAVLALCQQLGAPTMGEFSRAPFVDGWKTLNCDTLEKQRAYIPTLRQNYSTDAALQKKVYLFTFAFARPPGAKALPLDTAAAYWRLLLASRWPARIADEWATFCETKWRRSVAKDTWNMLWEFADVARADPTLASYDTEAAWPSVLDAFVEYVRSRPEGEGEGAAAAKEMDVSS